MEHNGNQARPFVKWVGGKTQLLDEIERSLPANFRMRRNVTYVEPFVGGGAVLFWIMQKYPNITHAVINDINAELICTYRVIKSQVDDLINTLQVISSEYLSLDQEGRKEYFIRKRTLFNSKKITDVQTAALFIFLNRTCFNGLYRVNSRGEFNVPHGKYVNPKICDGENLLAVSKLLKNVEILCGDFTQTAKYADGNALFYLDPPYRPLTGTSAFTSYSPDGFDDSDQIRLKDFCEEISRRGAIFVASNSDPKNVSPSGDFFDNLYDRYAIRRVLATRMVNSVSSGRGPLSEIIISNCVNI